MAETKSLQQIALDFVELRDEKTFTSLYHRLRPGLRKFIQKFLQDPEEVDDVLSITLSKAFVYADKYDAKWNFSTWIYKICQNECLMELRRKNQISSLDVLMDSKITINAVADDYWKTTPDYEVFNQDEIIHADSLYTEVLEEIRNLPSHYKEIIEDRIIDKLKYKDIAIKRNLKVNTVRSRIHSAKKVIKNLWIEKHKNTNSKTINIIGVTILQLLGENEKPAKNKHESAKNIVIIKVLYGAGSVWIDVTEKGIKSFEVKREIKSSNRLGGDPCYGSAKALMIDYICDDKNYSVEIKEGKTFSI